MIFEAHIFTRSVILEWLVTWRKGTTTSLMEERFQSSGQHQRYEEHWLQFISNSAVLNMLLCIPRLSTTRSTQQPVMCGVLDVLCMKYGVLDTNLLKATPTLTYVDISHTITYVDISHTIINSSYHSTLCQHQPC